MIGGAAYAQTTAVVTDEYVPAREAVTARGMAPKMRVSQLSPTARTFRVVFGKGDEVASGLAEFAEKNHIQNAHFTAVGAFDSATLGFGDIAKQAHRKILVNGEAELVSFSGGITSENGKPRVHAHAVFALPDATTRGGHFIDGHVSITMEVYVVDNGEGGESKTP